MMVIRGRFAAGLELLQTAQLGAEPCPRVP